MQRTCEFKKEKENNNCSTFLKKRTKGGHDLWVKAQSSIDLVILGKINEKLSYNKNLMY
jgi:hypothetical protein